MQFGIKKCGVLIMETGKVIRTNDIRLSDGQDMKTLMRLVLHTQKYWKLIR